MQWRAEPTQVLRDAQGLLAQTTDYLRKYGWCRGTIGVPGQPRCLIGSLATTQRPNFFQLSNAFWANMQEGAPGVAMAAMLEALKSDVAFQRVVAFRVNKGPQFSTPESLLSTWNDGLAMDVDAVFDMLAASSELLNEELTARALSIPQSERPLVHVH